MVKNETANDGAAKEATMLDIRCPDCDRKLTAIEAADAATTVVRRKCRCGEHWNIVAKPMGSRNGIRLDELTWARIALV